VTEIELRKIIAAALEDGGCYALRDRGWTDEFLAGQRSVALSEIDIDSLAIMELCIALEVETGYSMLPDELLSAGSLSAVVTRVMAAL
jgi:acyl carrier protein